MSGSFFTPIELEVIAKLANASQQLNDSLQQNDSSLSIEWFVKVTDGPTVASQADDPFSDMVFIHGQDD